MGEIEERRAELELRKGVPLGKANIGFLIDSQIQRINSSNDGMTKLMAIMDLEANLTTYIENDPYYQTDRETLLKKIYEEEHSQDFKDLEEIDKAHIRYKNLNLRYVQICRLVGDKFYPGVSLRHDGITYNEPDLNPLLAMLRTRCNEEKRGTIIFAAGATGTGKSTVGLKIGCDFDPEFRRVWDTRVCFDVISLLKKINDHTLNYGSVICFEEGGKNISNHAWHSEFNKAVKEMAQLIRYRRLVIIINACSKNLIDKQTRERIDFEIEARKINFEKNKNIIGIYELSYNNIKNEIFPRKLRSANGNVYDSFEYTPPDKELMDAYTALSEKWKGEELIKTVEALTSIEATQETKDSLKDIFLACQATFTDKKLDAPFMKNYAGHKKFDKPYLMSKYALTDHQARSLIVRLRTMALEEFNISL